MNFKELQADIHNNAKAHGWWDEDRAFGELIALCHSELSEALEEYRKGHDFDTVYYSEGSEEQAKMNGWAFKPEGIPTELADVVIRIMDMCGRYDIDLESAIKEKHEYNKTRPYKHGGKVI